MGFDDALNKAKGFADENPDKVHQGIDTASEKVQERTGDNLDGHVEKGADFAKDRFGGAEQGQQNQNQQGQDQQGR